MIKAFIVDHVKTCTLFVLSIVAVNSSSANAVVASLTASRTACTSPCTVVFSAQTTTDAETPLDHDIFKELSYHFTFDDPASGLHKTTELSQNAQVGGPLATHTFICTTGSCRYDVGVRAQNVSGDFDDDFVTVTVRSAEAAYTPENTICVSTSGVYSGDRACPTGSSQRRRMPSISEFSGKRILFRKGEVFGGDLCVDYNEKNILISSFGNDGEAKPELTGSVQLGVNGRCRNAVRIDTQQARNLGDKWSENITISDLRLPEVRAGMSFHNIGLHALDMDYSSEARGGLIVMTTAGSRCTKTSSLDCSAVPYPHGLYLSDITIAGSLSNPPGVNIVGYNCPMINWLGMIGTTARNSVEHQFRLEGGQRLSFSHNNMQGYTLRSARKHTMTLRSCGYGDIDIAQQNSRHNTVQGTIDAPWSRWAVFADNIHGSPGATNASFKLHIAPTNGNAVETIVDAIVERARFVTGDNSSIDLALNGYYLTARTNNTYTPEKQDCKDIGPASNPVHGQIDCAADVLMEPLPPQRVSKTGF